MHKPILLLSILFIVCQRRVCQRRDYLTSIVKLILQKNSNLESRRLQCHVGDAIHAMLDDVGDTNSRHKYRHSSSCPDVSILSVSSESYVSSCALILHILCKLRWQFLSRNFQFNTYNICKRKVQIINNTINKD